MKKDILSSYALFSKLKDEGKSIYDVIKVFIAAYLQESKKYEFSLLEITFGINTDFNFKLPAAVIRKALVKMKGISHSNDEKYSVDYSSLANINVSEIKKLEDSINKVLLSLRLYIENKNNKEQNEQEKNDLNDDFLKYLMYSSCSEINMKFISAFLLENENDSLIVEMINAIKEGAIIYTGITTDLNIDDNNIDNLGIWRKEITIFLDTEILFHLYGYNGEYYKQQADDFISKQAEENRPSKEETEKLFALYEKTFNHQAFTGRSGTFYAYEGLGSIYWHMVSKLLLAVQENIFAAYKQNYKTAAKELAKLYYEVRNGLGFNKTPQLYGAFPADPYSHTPYHKGAKQPGMTGQVKEEILTRWGELGIFVEKGEIFFNPIILRQNEIKSDGTLSFTWCGIPVKYIFDSNAENSISIDGKTKAGTKIEKTEAKSLFERKNAIKEIAVTFGKESENFAS